MRDNEAHSDAALGSPFFHSLGRFVLSHRVVISLSALAILLCSSWIAQRSTRLDGSIEYFLDGDSPTRILLDEHRAQFGDDRAFLVVAAGDVFSRTYLERLDSLHHALAALKVPDQASDTVEQAQDAEVEQALDEFNDFDSEGWGDAEAALAFERVTSLINARRTQATDDGIEVGELMPDLPDEQDLQALRKVVLKNPVMVPNLVDEKGRHSVVILELPALKQQVINEIHRQVAAVLASYSTPQFRIQLAGQPALDATLNGLIFGDMLVLVILSMVIMLAVMALVFRRLIAVIAPFLVLGITLTTTAAILGVLGIPFTMLSNIIPPFLFCVGLSQAIHLLSVYRDAIPGKETRDEAIIEALSTTGIPIFYASVTTMLGMLSFGLTSQQAIQEMGYGAAIGTAVTFFFSVTLLPVLISFRSLRPSIKRARRRRDPLERFLEFCLGLSHMPGRPGERFLELYTTRRRIRTLKGLVLLVLFASVGISLLRVSHNPLSWLPDDLPIKRAIATADAHLGGAASLELLIQGTDQKGIKDHALVTGLVNLEEHIMSFRHPRAGDIIGGRSGILDVMRETHGALTGQEVGHQSLPTTDRGIADALFLFENAGPKELRRWASADLQRARSSFRLEWMDAVDYGALTDHVAAGVKKFIPDSAQVQPTGTIYTLGAAVAFMIQDLLVSFGGAFLMISLIMVLLLRDLKLALIAMVPNLVPVALILGFMGYADVPIDMSNLLIASIALGLAVDDTIHFLHQFRVNYAVTGNVEQALHFAKDHAGRAMVITSLVLMLGFGSYLGATMYSIQRFGLLVGATAIMALLIDVIFAPALVRTFYANKRMPKGSTSHVGSSQA